MPNGHSVSIFTALSLLFLYQASSTFTLVIPVHINNSVESNIFHGRVMYLSGTIILNVFVLYFLWRYPACHFHSFSHFTYEEEENYSPWFPGLGTVGVSQLRFQGMVDSRPQFLETRVMITITFSLHLGYLGRYSIAQRRELSAHEFKMLKRYINNFLNQKHWICLSSL